MSEIEKAIKIAEDKNICEFCGDCGNDDVCIKCKKVSPVPIDDLRNFYSVAIQALQEKLEREEGFEFESSRRDREDRCKHRCCNICDRLRREKAEREKYPNGWIPVSERLPEKYCEDGILYNFQKVLVSCENGCVCDAIWCSDNFKRPDIMGKGEFLFDTNPVTAWQPLPSVWKGENNG